MVGFSNNSLLLFAVVVAMFFLMNPDRFVNAPDYSMVMPVKDNEENINVKVIRQNLEDIHVVRMKSTLKTGMSKHLKRKSSLMYSPDSNRKNRGVMCRFHVSYEKEIATFPLFRSFFYIP